MDLKETSTMPGPLCLEGSIYENWQKFKQEFSDFLVSNEFDEKSDKVKAAKLRNIIGDGGRQIISSLSLINSENYGVMLETLDKWAETQRNTTLERSKFYSRVQNEGESFEQFLNDIKNLSCRCNFGILTEELLRDKVVTGILNCPLKELFSTKPEVSFETAVQMCRTADLSEEQLLKLLALKRKGRLIDGDAHEVSTQTPALNNLKKENEKVVEESVHDCSKDSCSYPTTPGKNHSEATLRLIVKNISKLEETRYSCPCYVNNLPWRIQFEPGKRLSDKKKSLGIFLECNNGSIKLNWECSAKAELSLLPQKEEVAPMSLKFEHVFCSQESNWGFESFILWENLLNPEKGFIKEDSIIIEIHFSADVPNRLD